ncbi:phospholipid scramblase 3-like [Hyperolius riggenbachi]|uniref:phospholipid scramblase 3-like n=1 Tax=Hyperolius riggenbachi TaxID=752182 RepID=UPI0035A33D2A
MQSAGDGIHGNTAAGKGEQRWRVTSCCCCSCERNELRYDVLQAGQESFLFSSRSTVVLPAWTLHSMSALSLMGVMARIPIAPPGLEQLVQVAGIRVKQTNSSFAFDGSTYDVLTPIGSLIYQARDERSCCGPRMDVGIFNAQGQSVVHLSVPDGCFTWETRLEVSSSTSGLLGYIDKKVTSFAASFDILDPSGRVVLKVKGPGWGEAFMSDTNYQVVSADKTAQVGIITRVWRGISTEMFSNKDNYMASFPLDLDVNMKAMLMACTLFIDLLREEEKRKNN